MANYENRLSEWFKQVEKRAEEIAKKRSTRSAPPDESVHAAEAPPPPQQQPRAVEMQSPVREAPESSLATAMEARHVKAEVAVQEDTEEITGDPRPIAAASEPARSLFEDADVPQVEDFLSFLSKSATREPAAAEPEAEPYVAPKDQGTLIFAEGTGEPRPIVKDPNPEAVVTDPAPVSETQLPKPTVETVTEPKPAEVREEAPVVTDAPVVHPKPAAVPKPAPAALSAEEKWGRIPRHLQTLFSGDSGEVAQNSYKTFKETRTQLIERLLDPVISLEEAARVLNVCPTTVRRYTNRGALRCLRTAGNQRRFKLSDVLSFMENGARARGGSAAGDAEEES